MSLLLVVRKDEVAVVSSDGRSVRRVRGGGMRPITDDARKVYRLGPTLVLGLVGDVLIGRMILACVRAFLWGRERGRKRWPVSSDFQALSQIMPVIARAAMVYGGSCRHPAETSAVLVGRDLVFPKLRCIWYQSLENFVPRETDELLTFAGAPSALDDVDHATDRREVMRELEDSNPVAVENALRKLITHAAGVCPEVGGDIFVETIALPPKNFFGLLWGGLFGGGKASGGSILCGPLPR
jgi:hypothetical protein